MEKSSYKLISRDHFINISNLPRINQTYLILSYLVFYILLLLAEEF